MRGVGDVEGEYDHPRTQDREVHRHELDAVAQDKSDSVTWLEPVTAQACSGRVDRGVEAAPRRLATRRGVDERNRVGTVVRGRVQQVGEVVRGGLHHATIVAQPQSLGSVT